MGLACETFERKEGRLFLDRSSAKWFALVEMYTGDKEKLSL